MEQARQGSTYSPPCAPGAASILGGGTWDLNSTVARPHPTDYEPTRPISAYLRTEMAGLGGEPYKGETPPDLPVLTS